jgi:hypothetical protein
VSTVFVNVHDPAVNNRVALRLYDLWRRRGARVIEELFDAGPLPHDIIDDSAGTLPIDRIYPAIMELVERADALAKAG